MFHMSRLVSVRTCKQGDCGNKYLPLAGFELLIYQPIPTLLRVHLAWPAEVQSSLKYPELILMLIFLPELMNRVLE